MRLLLTFAVLSCVLLRSSAVGVEWAWLGALQPTSVVLKARLSSVVAAENVRAAVALRGSGAAPREYTSDHVGAMGMAWVVLDELVPNSEYEYSVGVGAGPELRDHNASVSGRFRTPGPAGEALSFSFGFASCADNHSNHVVFDVIREHDPLFFLHMGDLHYGNVEVNEERAFHGLYDQVLGNPRQASFFRNVPFAYMFDDHDFGPNNSDESSPGREASIASYLEAVPHYPLAAYTDPRMRARKRDKAASVFFAFSVGRVRFVVTDTSSSRVEGQTVLGAEQLEWFKGEMLSAAQTHALVVWVSTMPWNTVRAKWGAGAFRHERSHIAEFLRSTGVSQKVIQLAGDAHMLALDDGTHVPGGFPVFQAAALDAKPTCKGGPYSHGIYPGRGQYGWMSVVDGGDDGRLCVELQGRRVDGETAAEQVLLRFNTCHPEVNSPRNTYFPSPPWVERTWKVCKQFLSADVMVFFDGLTFSFAMALWSASIASVALIVAALSMWLLFIRR